MQQVWPQIRASRYFCLKARYGIYKEGRQGQLTVNGFSPAAVLEWTVAETLPELYRNARLGGIYEMLAATEMIEARGLSA